MNEYKRNFLIKSVFNLLVLGLFFSPSFLVRSSLAATPKSFGYQGQLADSAGNPLGGSGSVFYFKFSLWDHQEVRSGNRVWPLNPPGRVALLVKNGVFSVAIGDVNLGYPDVLDYDISKGGKTYLQIEVSPDGSSFHTLSPRQPITQSESKNQVENDPRFGILTEKIELLKKSQQESDAELFRTMALLSQATNFGPRGSAPLIISNPIIEGEVRGLKDSDLPDDITASRYLLLSGGNLTGSLGIATTLSIASASPTGVLNVGGDILSKGVITAENLLKTGMLIATSTDTALIFANPTYIKIPAGNNALRIATTTTENNIGEHPIILLSATTTGNLGYARVAIGTSTSSGPAGILDQLFVAGRINSSWNVYWNDFLGRDNIAKLTADAAVDGLVFDEVTGNSGGWDTITVAGVGGVARLDNPTTPSAGEGEWFGTGGVNTLSASLNPVFEASLRSTANTDHRAVAGFMSIAMGASIGTDPTNGIYLRKASTDTTWQAVTRSGAVETVTNTDVPTSDFKTLRIEVSGTKEVRFIVGGYVKAVHNTNIPTVDLGFYIGNQINSTTNRATDIDYLRVWTDEPPSKNINDVVSEISEKENLEKLEPSTYANLAVLYFHENPGLFSEGTLVSLATTGDPFIKLADHPYDDHLIGVVHENPGTTLGRGNVPVAREGIAKAKVSLENGPIKRGDFITMSSAPGVGMRATKPGKMLGQALEGWDTASCSNNSDDGCYGTILVDLRVGFDMNLGSLLEDAAILFTKFLTILRGGEIKVPEGENEISGVGRILGGTSEIFIANNKITSSSKILVTPTVVTRLPLAVIEKRAGVGFRVAVADPSPDNILFDWLIINSYSEGGSAVTPVNEQKSQPIATPASNETPPAITGVATNSPEQIFESANSGGLPPPLPANQSLPATETASNSPEQIPENVLN